MQVIIVVDEDGDLSSPSSFMAQQVAALRQAIESNPLAAGSFGSEDSIQVEAIEVVAGRREIQKIMASSEPKIFCPLTLHLPGYLPIVPQQEIYAFCREIAELRQTVAQTFSVPVGDGCYWLPIVLTAKGGLYAEVIGTEAGEVVSAAPASPDLQAISTYYQPIHLSDRWRQPLYQLGHQLLRHLDAPPSVYLLQFGFKNEQIQFDRLFPFPAAPAIASLTVQSPDLFTCYWRCITNQPILDLLIQGDLLKR
ncbi:MAG TPA: hypothetical protein V6D10_02480 [Trichocoleus sp.]